TLTFSLILFSIIFANTKEFVVWFFGPKFVPMTANMMIVSFIIILNPIGGIFSNQFALAMEKDKEYGIPLIIGSIVSLLGNYILVPIYNALGATIVLVFVELIVCILRIVLIKDFINLQFLITKQILIELGLTIAITITGLLLPSIFANSFFNIAYKSMVMLLLFGIILFTTKSEVVLDVKKILKGTKN
ncbi:polysaccharide biosynthesis C-terminal domain-containing protein, partial [Enterococcus faecalis]|nr:polysaccharide biosynthesis C-terminal domain-containing protein [Enterococcus faecalis]